MTRPQELDVIEMAIRIGNGPRREAMAASVDEIVALATALVEVWTAALGAEAVLEAIKISEDGAFQSADAGTMAAIRTFRHKFLNHMEAFRTIEGDEDNGKAE